LQQASAGGGGGGGDPERERALEAELDKLSAAHAEAEEKLARVMDAHREVAEHRAELSGRVADLTRELGVAKAAAVASKSAPAPGAAAGAGDAQLIAELRRRIEELEATIDSLHAQVRERDTAVGSS
jgi:phage shock protein A